MIGPKHLSSLGLPLLGQPVMIPHAVRCGRSEKGDRERVEVQSSDKVADDIGPCAVVVDAVKNVACGFNRQSRNDWAFAVRGDDGDA